MQGKARQGKERQGKARDGEAWRGTGDGEIYRGRKSKGEEDLAEVAAVSDKEKRGKMKGRKGRNGEG